MVKQVHNCGHLPNKTRTRVRKPVGFLIYIGVTVTFQQTFRIHVPSSRLKCLSRAFQNASPVVGYLVKVNCL